MLQRVAGDGLGSSREKPVGRVVAASSKAPAVQNVSLSAAGVFLWAGTPPPSQAPTKPRLTCFYPVFLSHFLPEFLASISHNSGSTVSNSFLFPFSYHFATIDCISCFVIYVNDWISKLGACAYQIYVYGTLTMSFVAFRNCHVD